MSHLSEHFTYDEMTYSSTATKYHIDNTPNAAQLENLTDLCLNLLEPIRTVVGPLIVNSGFRCEGLNKKVGGVTTSAHQDGRAADVVPQNTDMELAFSLIRNSKLVFDQLILEPTWIHIGSSKAGTKPRRQVLKAHPTDQGMVYTKI